MDLSYTVEILNKKHDRKTFCCGIDSLDYYLKNQAGQEARKRVAVPYLLVHKENENRIAGYFTLSSTHIITNDIPETLSKTLPRYNYIPATLIGRLAIDKAYQGQGLGSVLVVEALKQSYLASQHVASFAVVVDAKDEHAESLYLHFGFISFSTKRRRLFLPMKLVKSLL